MKIYTRKGDTGQTGLLGSGTVPKNCIRVASCGDVDELNAAIGCTLAGPVSPEIAVVLTRVQHELFNLGAMLAYTADSDPPGPQISLEHVGRLEVDIDRLSESLEELGSFILPGGDGQAAQLHLARTVCRRAERSVVSLSHEADVPAACLGYLNRLSDLLFVMARYQNRHAGKRETPWKP